MAELPRIEAPVVVTPDMDSKKASVMFGIAPVMMNGSDEKSATENQASVTMANPSLTEIVTFPRVRIQIGKLTETVIPEDMSKPSRSGSLK